MKKIKSFEWVRDPGKYTDGSLLKIGNVVVAATHRAIGSKSEPDAPLWFIEMRLPGIALKKDDRGNVRRFMTEDEIKPLAERLMFTWFGWVTE